MTTPTDAGSAELVMRLSGIENLLRLSGQRFLADELARDIQPVLALETRIRALEEDCAFLLSVIDSCDEAEAPSCEMEPEDVANIARIRAALTAQEQG